MALWDFSFWNGVDSLAGDTFVYGTIFCKRFYFCCVGLLIFEDIDFMRGTMPWFWSLGLSRKPILQLFSVVLVCSLLSRAILFRIYLSSRQLVLVQCGDRKTSPVLHYSVQYSLYFLLICDHWVHSGTLFLNMYMRVTYEQFLLFSTIFCYLLLDSHVKIGTIFSHRDNRLFEISEVEITRVDCSLSGSENFRPVVVDILSFLWMLSVLLKR